MPLSDIPLADASRLTVAVIIMIFIVFLYTTGKLLTSPVQVGLGTVVLEYVPICFWSIIAYRLLKYDKAVNAGYIPCHESEYIPQEGYEDQLDYMRDTYYDYI